MKKDKIVQIHLVGTNRDTLEFLKQSYGQSYEDIIHNSLRLLANFTTGDKKKDTEFWNSII